MSVFLQELVKDVILPLQKFQPMAHRLMAKTTLAAILWAVFKQGCQFTLDQMEDGGGDRAPEWDTAVTMICSKSDFSLLEVPLAIKGMKTIAVATGTGKRKEREPEGEAEAGKYEDPPATPKKARKERYDGKNFPVHTVIQVKLTSALPDKFQMRKLTAALCGIKEMEHIFPEEPQLCLHVALRGFCPFYRMCKKKHDPSLVTDTMAENAINLFDPFIKNLKILSEGKNKYT